MGGENEGVLVLIRHKYYYRRESELLWEDFLWVFEEIRENWGLV